MENGEWNSRKKTTVREEVLLTGEMTPQEMLDQVVEYYHQTAKESPELIAYLKKRGLLPAEADQEFILHSPFSIPSGWVMPTGRWG